MNPSTDRLTAIATTVTIIVVLTSLWNVTVKRAPKEKILVNNHSSSQIPTPKWALPYIGHMLQVNSKKLPALKFHGWHNIYGPLICVQMGIQPWVIIGNRLLAHSILKSEGAKSSDRPLHPFLEYYSINQRGLTFTYPDNRWKKCRAIAQGLFSAKGVSKIVHIIEEESIRMKDLLIKDTIAKNNIDVVKYMQFAPLNVILRLCFGIQATSVDDPLFQNIVSIVDTTVQWGAPGDDLGNFLPLFAKIRNIVMLRGANPSKKRYEEFIYKKRDPLFRQLIKEAFERDDNENCITKQLYRVKEENDFEDDDILLFLADLGNAGVDPTAMSLAWSFIILSHYEDVQKRIRDEIDAFIIKYNRLPFYEERLALPYLISVQKECLRFRPPNHLALPHKATENIECQGYTIPKGTVILANTYSINLDSDYYLDPEKFKPERYMDDLTPFAVSVNSNVEKRDQFMFGWGRRLCPGVHLAEVELFHYWVQIFANTIIAPPLDDKGSPVFPDLDARRDAGLVVAPLESEIRFIKRNDGLV